MNYSISIDHKLKIIKYKHSGSLSIPDIGEAWSEFLEIKEFTQEKYNLLSDYSESKFEIPVKDIGQIINHLSHLKDIIKGKKQAMILNDPVSTAGSMLFEAEVMEEFGFIVRQFSTEAAALKWLSPDNG